MPFCRSSIQPGVAQLVARLLWEQDAAGSNPVTRTIFHRKTAKKRRFFCVKSLFFEFRTTAYQPWSEGKSGDCGLGAEERRNQQNP